MRATLSSHVSSPRFSDVDISLRQLAVSSLETSGYVPLGRLGCRVQNGIVELSGVVPSYFMKQMAQAVVLRLEPVKGVRNLVQVV